ncbi:MAG: radical SAM protein [Candidatus Velamenicoccus archaeovorus]
MKIVLIEPGSTIANVYSKISMPLLGPVYLGTILRNQGHEVEIYKEDIYTPDYANIKADIIGISILTATANRGYEIARRFPKEKVIMGGVHASLVPEEARKFARQVVVGEAEEVIGDIVNGKIRDEVVYGKPVEDLDLLPYPDFSLIKGYRLPAFITPVLTSRGCPFDCSFCSVTKMFGRKYRFRSAENIRKELLAVRSKNIFFCDDNFTANPKRTRQLLEFLVRMKKRHWTCQVRCDAAKDEGLLTLMARAGCSTACIGFESVNHKTLKAYDKKQTIEEIIHAIGSFHKKKIKIHGMFVLGGDDDDKKTVWDTLRFAMRHKIDTIQMMILTPLPGTKVYEDLEKQKRIFSRDWSLYDGQHIVFAPKLLSARELQMNVLKAYARFYSVYNTMVLFVRLHFRNAFLRLMGHKIVKDWLRHNRSMRWLAQEGIFSR